MSTVTIRQEGDETIFTMPSRIMKQLNLKIGAQLKLTVVNGALLAHPIQADTYPHYTTETLPVTKLEDMAVLSGN